MNSFVVQQFLFLENSEIYSVWTGFKLAKKIRGS